MPLRVDFTGQVALVTGATRGIGRQIAADLGRLGAELICTASTREGADAVDAWMAEGDMTGECHVVEMTDRRSISSFAERMAARERIDVCVNNAGTNRIAPLVETDPTDWDDILAVNLTAPFLITRSVCKVMSRNGYGRVVNISSVFGVISRAHRVGYSASKFGLRGLTVAVSNELARSGVLVNTVSPGFVLTDLTRRILSAEEIDELARQVPIGRLGTPDEISRVVLFLASDLNTYVAGANLVVDGGFVDV